MKISFLFLSLFFSTHGWAQNPCLNGVSRGAAQDALVEFRSGFKGPQSWRTVVLDRCTIGWAEGLFGGRKPAPSALPLDCGLVFSFSSVGEAEKFASEILRQNLSFVLVQDIYGAVAVPVCGGP